MGDEEKGKALELILSQIRKKHGEGAIMKLGAAPGMDVEGISTGSLGLDIASGIGGVPRGRVTEIFGPEASGKTTICQHIIAAAQKAGGIAAFIDTEHAMDPSYAAKCGVDIDNLYISQPDTAEQALEITEALVRSGAIDVVIIDSVAAMVPRAEIEGDIGDPQVGLQARILSQALRRLAQTIGRSRTAVIFTNQIRMKIGVLFGNPETTPGGRALKHYASLRIDTRRIDAVKEGRDIVGSRTRVSIKKNKVAPPFRDAEFDILYNEGISREGEVLDIGAEMGIIDKKGSYYSYGDLKMGQGRENAKAFLKDNPSSTEELSARIREAAGLPKWPPERRGEAPVENTGLKA